MKDELPRPGVQHAQRGHFAAQFGKGHLAQRLPGDGEEQIVKELQVPFEQRPQFLRDGERQKKIRHGQQAQLAFFQPVAGLQCAALRTGAVMTGMIRKLQLAAGRTTVEMAAALGGAATQNGVDGAALFGTARHAAMRAQELGKHGWEGNGETAARHTINRSSAARAWPSLAAVRCV